MSRIIITGNLTKDAELRTTEKGNKYALLQIAENIRKRDEKGEYIKDANGHFENAQTLYHSVFVNKSDAVLLAMDLKKGAPLKIAGTARFKVQKDANNYEYNVLDRIVAYYIDTDPFAETEEESPMMSDSELEMTETIA